MDPVSTAIIAAITAGATAGLTDASAYPMTKRTAVALRLVDLVPREWLIKPSSG